MTHYLKLFGNTNGTILLAISFFTILSANAQKKKKGGLLGEIRQGIEDVRGTAKEVSGATKEVTKTVKSVKQLKQTWSKDESPNIKYKQNPDYKNIEEIEFDKNQKLTISKGEFKNLSWSPRTFFEQEVFPSFIIGWSLYSGDKNEDMGSSLGFTINNSHSKIVGLKWEIECVDRSLFGIDSGYVNIPSKQSLNFMPKINWNYKELTKHQSSEPVNIKFRLIDPNTSLQVEKTTTINLRSINDCVRFYNKKDYRFMYASYVNEDHPEIDKILHQGLKTKMVKDFFGYQGDKIDVLLQVATINRVLHERGFKYSDITNSSGNNKNSLRSQSIRTFANAIKTNQANCVDGTVVFASILKKIDLNTYITTVNGPEYGHCILGFSLDGTENNLLFLETTLLSDETFIKNPKLYAIDPKYKDFKTFVETVLQTDKRIKETSRPYLIQFLYAVYKGQSTYEEKSANPEFTVSLHDVTELRKTIRPIPFYE